MILHLAATFCNVQPFRKNFSLWKKQKKHQKPKTKQKKTTDAGAQEIPYPIYREIKNVNFYSLEAGLFPDCSPSHQGGEDHADT